jgi:hypothetical protein
MSNVRSYEILRLGSGGVQATGASTSGRTAIPNAADGNRAQRVRITAVTPSETVYILPCLNGQSVTASTGLPVCKEYPIALDVSGYTHIAALRAGTQDVLFNITPIED